MVYKIKRLKTPKLSKKELGYYEKGYMDGEVGNRKAYSINDLKKKDLKYKWDKELQEYVPSY